MASKEIEYLKRYGFGYARMIDVSKAPLFLGHIVTFTDKLSVPICKYEMFHDARTF